MYAIKPKSNILESIKKITINDSKFGTIFIKDKVRIMAVGTGKTFSCGHIILEEVVESRQDSILIISTMRNNLIDGIILEFAKNLENYAMLNNCILDFKSYIEELRTFKNTSKLLKQLGILVMTSINPLNVDDLDNCRVILTNHAYFFPHGHSSKYNSNCYKINDFLVKSNKSVKVVYDEFDQYHKMGVSEVQLNYYVGNNFSDRNNVQKIISDHAFKYCRSVDLSKNQSDCNSNDDFYYKLPVVSYQMKLDSNSKGIPFYNPSLNGVFNFKNEILDNLEFVGVKEYINQSKHSKKRGTYHFMIVNEISRCKFSDLNVMGKYDTLGNLMASNNSIILRVQKLKVFEDDNGKQGNLIKMFNFPNEVLEWAMLNMDKKSWVNLYNSFSVEGKELFVNKMIISKKPFVFCRQSNYYVTATPGVLNKLGYDLDTTLQYKKVTDMEYLDVFVVQNKTHSISDIDEFLSLLRQYSSLETFIVIDKEDSLNDFVNKNLYDKNYSCVNAVLKSKIIELGRLPSTAKRTNKNITMVYQKGNETQGTNYKEHSLMFQDCHCKISSNERIVANLSGEIDILDYTDAVIKQLTQSTGRICRGDLKYKALILFADFLDNDNTEKEIIIALIDEIKKYGFNIDLTFVEKDITKKNDKYYIFNSILKHVYDRHNYYNLASIVDIVYTFNLNNLYNKTETRGQKKKYNELGIYNYYLESKYKLQLEHNRKIKDTEIIAVLNEKFGISNIQFKRIKSKFKNIILDNKDKEEFIIDYSKIVYLNMTDYFDIDNTNAESLIKLSYNEYFRENKKDTISNHELSI